MRVAYNEAKKTNFVNDIISILVEQQAIAEKEASTIVKAFSDSTEYEFDDFLLETSIVRPEQLLAALERYYRVPAFDVVGHFFESVLLHKFPKQFLLYYGIIPLEDDGITLVLVASDPNNHDLLLEIVKYVSCDIQFRVGIYQDIIDAVKEFYDAALTEDGIQDIYDEPDTPIARDSDFEHFDAAQGFLFDHDEQE